MRVYDKVYFKIKLCILRSFFHNFFTFAGKPAICIEDIFVKPRIMGKRSRKSDVSSLCEACKKRNCRRVEWGVPYWNPARKYYEHLGGCPVEGWHIYRSDADKFEDVLEK